MYCSNKEQMELAYLKFSVYQCSVIKATLLIYILYTGLMKWYIIYMDRLASLKTCHTKL